MVCPQSKKRDRLPSPSKPSIMSSTYQEEEYERAVAFLQEFRSRRVAALHVVDRSLGVITEEFDDLADDFSLALNVDMRRGLKSSFCGKERPIMSRTPKMKKTTTFTSLVDLADSSEEFSSTSSSGPIRSAFKRPPCRPKPMNKYDVDADDNIVYCIDNSPMSKRQRGRLW